MVQNTAAADLPQVELRTWFVEPVLSSDHHLSPGLVRVWGAPKTNNQAGKWWRSSSIRQRLSSTTLKTRFGTLVKLNGTICKKYAKKLHMAETAVHTFQDGFPATWKRLLPTAFNAEALAEKRQRLDPTKLRRSTRCLANDKKCDETHSDIQSSLPEVSGVMHVVSEAPGPRPLQNSALKHTRSVDFKASQVGTPVKPITKRRRSIRREEKKIVSGTDGSASPPRRVLRRRESFPNEGAGRRAHAPDFSPAKKRVTNATKGTPARPDRKKASKERTSLAELGRSTRNSTKEAITESKLRASEANLTVRREPHQLSSRKGRKKKEESKTGGNQLAERLKNAQEVKRVRRARRVAFADVEVHLDQLSPSPPSLAKLSAALAPLVPKKDDEGQVAWSEKQRKAFEQQRNSVPADDAEYWESLASAVPGKSAEQCRQLWESSWASPKVKEGRKKKTGGSALEMGTGEMVAALQKGGRRARVRNSGKFRKQTRELAERVAKGTADAALEPVVPGAASVADVVVTPRAQMSSALGDGTPGTIVRARREENERAGAVETPELLSRGKVFGLQEADMYVALFKRRIAQGKGSEKNDKEKDGAGTDEAEVRRIEMDEVRVGSRGILGEDGSEYSDDSEDSAPFF